MGHPQYKTSAGASLADVPAAALGNFGANGSGPVVVDPEPAGIAGDGTPCGAVGRPVIRLALEFLSGAGMDWWADLFASRTALTATLWLEAWDPRAAAWVTYTGLLTRPKFNRVDPGNSAAATLFYDVSIEMIECVAA
jgi:hypothetical protein